MSNRAPRAVAGGPYVAIVGQPLLLNGSASSDDVAVVKWKWLHPDGSELAMRQPTAAVVFQELGTFTVKLTVTDESGAYGTDTATVSVVPPPPPEPPPAVVPPAVLTLAVTQRGAQVQARVGMRG